MQWCDLPLHAQGKGRTRVYFWAKKRKYPRERGPSLFRDIWVVGGGGEGKSVRGEGRKSLEFKWRMGERNFLENFGTEFVNWLLLIHLPTFHIFLYFSASADWRWFLLFQLLSRSATSTIGMARASSTSSSSETSCTLSAWTPPRRYVNSWYYFPGFFPHQSWNVDPSPPPKRKTKIFISNFILWPCEPLKL